MPIQNHMQYDELSQRKALHTNFVTIENLTKTAFSYGSNDTKRNPWVMLRLHCPINDSSGYFQITVYLAVILKASCHTAEDN